MTAIQLVDNVLEQSVLIINSQQHSSNTLHSESEHFAITCDVHGVDLIKSPTIESMSGKSFDDNLSVPDVSASYNLNAFNNTNTTTANNNINTENSNNSCSHTIINSNANANTSIDCDNTNCTQSMLLHRFVSKQSFNESDASSTSCSSHVDQHKLERIDRKFETLSSQLHIDQMTSGDDAQTERNFEMAMSQVRSDELSNLQRDFSKISWDDSLSTTTAELAALTPDNDLHDLPKGD